MAAQLSNEAAFPGSSGAFLPCAGHLRGLRLLPMCVIGDQQTPGGAEPVAKRDTVGFWNCERFHSRTPDLKSATTRATNAATFAAAHSSR